MAFDLSGSMLAEDFKLKGNGPTARGGQGGAEGLRWGKAVGGIGLVAFAGRAYIAAR
ncbi:MAG: hypothetical protein CM1200mP34_2850 [Verrucomicrobiales bacterium]|nr:MAG: hypothetical protein CM1200mP34_2850 [Verrucomicrobiales bacterium]